MRTTIALLVLTAACGDQAETPSQHSANTQMQTTSDRFYLVDKKGTRTIDSSPVDLLPKFGVSIVEQRQFGNRLIGKTSSGESVLMKDLRPTQPSEFSGHEITDGNLNFGWTVVEGVPLRSSPEPSGAIVGRLPRLAIVTLTAKRTESKYVQVASATKTGWLATSDLRTPRGAIRPADVGFSEHWIDVDLTEQVLVAYKGNNPRFATLISGGVGKPGSTFATPLGTHRIIAKLISSTMDNLEHKDVAPYSYEDVPFTQYIGAVAIHGVYWHDGFGHPRSHGCINVSIRDAERLFAFTLPKLPIGDKQASGSNGTVIRVRQSPAE